MMDPVKTGIQPEKGQDMAQETTPIAKPEAAGGGAFSLDKFRSKHDAAMAGVKSLPTALPVLRLAEAKDWVRLHPDEETSWSPELCFVDVPIEGQKHDTMHLILDDLAMQYLAPERVKRFRLALAMKPHKGSLFLCIVPSRNLDNKFNETALIGCRQAKTLWTQVTSLKNQGQDCYRVDRAEHTDAFPDPEWSSESLSKLIEITFAGRMIDHPDHPALLRLRGARQTI
jgi:hypothetical protein